VSVLEHAKEMSSVLGWWARLEARGDVVNLGGRQLEPGEQLRAAPPLEARGQRRKDEPQRARAARVLDLPRGPAEDLGTITRQVRRLARRLHHSAATLAEGRLLVTRNVRDVRGTGVGLLDPFS